MSNGQNAVSARALVESLVLAPNIEFDGHDDDPHLGPALATLPVRGSDPLLLVELR